MRWNRVFVVCVAALCGGLGCSSQAPVIGTTLTDLIAESNEYKVDPSIDFRENVSINGLLTQPQVGAHWYTARPGFFDDWFGKTRSSPAFAIGISARLAQPSFCLVGETEPVDIKVVTAVQAKISSVQQAAVKAVEAAVSLSVAQAELRNLPVDKSLAAEVLQTKTTELTTRITALQTAKTAAATTLADERAEFDGLLAKNPGVIVARWTARNASGTSTKTGIFNISYDQSATTNGYLILGGVRVSSLYFGDDLRSYVNIIKKNERRLFDQLGITTYLLQTKALAWTNALDLQTAFSAAATLKLSSLGNPALLLTEADRITISTYIATARDLDNRGSLVNVRWYTTPRPMVEYVKIDGTPPSELAARAGFEWVQVVPAETFRMREPASPTEPRALTAATNPAEEGRSYLADTGWSTVMAVSATAPRLYKEFRNATGDDGPAFQPVGERSFARIDAASGRTVIDKQRNLVTP